MTIRCPHCGRDGKLPDKTELQVQVLRCRKCQGRFSTHTQAQQPQPHPQPQPIGVANGHESPFGASNGSRIQRELSRFPSGAAYLDTLDDDDDDDDDLAPIVTDADDSNYEIAVALEGELDDSQFELPALSESESDSDPASYPPDPRYYDLIDSWSRMFLYAAMSLGAPGLVVIGTFLVRALYEGQGLNRATVGLILGLVGTLAFMLVSGAATALNVLLVDLARNTRRLRFQADRGQA